jgi:hypothetical protein
LTGNVEECVCYGRPDQHWGNFTDSPGGFVGLYKVNLHLGHLIDA